MSACAAPKLATVSARVNHSKEGARQERLLHTPGHLANREGLVHDVKPHAFLQFHETICTSLSLSLSLSLSISLSLSLALSAKKLDMRYLDMRSRVV